VKRIIALALCTTVAAAQPADDAKSLYDKGVAAYTDHDYAAAVQAFHDAYNAEARPEFLFAWAQAERLSGDCASAIVHYRKFLDGHPPAVQAEAAQQPLVRCERALADQPPPPTAVAAPPPPPPPAPTPTPTPTPLAPPPPPPPPRHFYQDALGDALVAGGIVAAGVGVGLLAAAGSPDAATTWSDFQMRHDSAVTRQRFGAIALGVGAALIAGGVTHWVLWSQGGETGVAVAGRF